MQPRRLQDIRHPAATALALLVPIVLFSCDQPASDTPGEQPDPHVEVTEPGPPTLRRLTLAQYRATVRDLLGDVDTVYPLEPDTKVDGLASLGAAVAGVSPRGVEQYESAAIGLAAQVVGRKDRDAFFGCAPSSVDDTPCFTSALSTLGARAWRRPLSTEEVDRLVGVASLAASTLGDPWAGLEYGVSTLLQSPSFLYREEAGEPDPDLPGRLRFTDHEMASRLSYTLWGTMPDAELFAAADAGRLTDPVTLRAEVERMLSNERARAGVRAFFTELYHLDDLDNLPKDPTIFPNVSPTLGPAMREETLRLVEWLTFDDPSGDYRDLFTTPISFVDRELAALYGVPAPSFEGWGQIEHPPSSVRRGLLGQASFLALEAHPVRSSITKRGEFVRTMLLCHIIPPPAADVDTSIPPATDEAQSLRDRVEIHLSDPTCASCHQLTDPIGLSLENFDGIGRFREQDAGQPIDPSGELDGLGFDDSAMLGEVLRDHPDAGPCLTSHVARYAMGRDTTSAEDPAVQALSDHFAADGHRLRSLLLELVTSPAFRTVGAVSEESP